MEKKCIVVGIIIVLIVVNFCGCLNESTASILAEKMESAFSSITSYRFNINDTYAGGYYTEMITSMKKPDKIRYEYLTGNRIGDLYIINGTESWYYDASKNTALHSSNNINIGEESLESPDFLKGLLWMVKNFNIIEQKDVLGEKTVFSIELTPKTEGELGYYGKLEYKLDNVTFIPLEQVVYDWNDNLLFRETITESEINLILNDSEFEVPEGATIIGSIAGIMNPPTTIAEIEAAAGFSIVYPTYLPEQYNLSKEFIVNAETISGIPDDGTPGNIKDENMNNNIRLQYNDLTPLVNIRYPNENAYAEFINLTDCQSIGIITAKDTTLPVGYSSENTYIVTHYNEVWLHEAQEEIFTYGYKISKDDVSPVTIKGIVGQYWTKSSIYYPQCANNLIQSNYLLWNIQEYYFLLETSGDSSVINSIFTQQEMIRIAESIVDQF